jgi:hypothetical protein
VTVRLKEVREPLGCARAVLWPLYNFFRIHNSIRVTPAMNAKITDYVWDLAELLASAYWISAS